MFEYCLFKTLSIILGLCFGSFITMLTYRLPRNESIVYGSSHCVNCNKKIKIISLIPLFSWIFQKGKCTFCGQKISIRYPLIELATAIAFFLIFLRFGISYNTIIFSFIFVVIFSIIIIDLQHYIINDSLQICLLLLAISYIFINKLDFLYQVFSAIIYFAATYITVFLTEKILKKEALGGGDLKLITVAGLFLGLEKISLFFILSGLIGIIFALAWKKIFKKEIFPFAPSLVISLFILICY